MTGGEPRPWRQRGVPYGAPGLQRVLFLQGCSCTPGLLAACPPVYTARRLATAGITWWHDDVCYWAASQYPVASRTCLAYAPMSYRMLRANCGDYSIFAGFWYCARGA